jgi:spermidine synthase
MIKIFFKEKLYVDSADTITYTQKFLNTKTLVKEISLFQEIEIFENPNFGIVLALDSVIQTTQNDEFFYHEMFSHVPIFSHKNPKAVLIIGGGDGGILRETIKHENIEKVVMIEIDAKVVELCNKFMPMLNNGAFLSSKAKVLIEDGIAYVKNTKEKFDIVIVDSTDPNPSSAVLFTKDFYINAKSKLNEGGILATQSGVPFFQPEEMSAIYNTLKSIFKYVQFFVVPVPTYIGGFMVLSFATDTKENLDFNLDILQQKLIQSNIIDLKYYNSSIHIASFSIPNYIKKLL